MFIIIVLILFMPCIPLLIIKKDWLCFNSTANHIHPLPQIHNFFQSSAYQNQGRALPGQQH